MNALTVLLAILVLVLGGLVYMYYTQVKDAGDKAITVSKAHVTEIKTLNSRILDMRQRIAKEIEFLGDQAFKAHLKKTRGELLSQRGELIGRLEVFEEESGFEDFRKLPYGDIVKLLGREPTALEAAGSYIETPCTEPDE